MKLLLSLSVLSSKKSCLSCFHNLTQIEQIKQIIYHTEYTEPQSARDRTGARRASATRAAICVLYSATLSLPLYY